VWRWRCAAAFVVDVASATTMSVALARSAIKCANYEVCGQASQPAQKCLYGRKYGGCDPYVLVSAHCFVKEKLGDGNVNYLLLPEVHSRSGWDAPLWSTGCSRDAAVGQKGDWQDDGGMD